MICLWDTSNKNYGDMNYYSREINTWFDEKIKNNFKKISKGKYEKPNDYFIMTNTLNVSSLNNDDDSSELSLNLYVILFCFKSL